jgi:hypothetical protein
VRRNAPLALIRQNFFAATTKITSLSLQKEKNEIKIEARKVRKQPVDNIREEIKENYEMGIEYYQDIEEHEE